MKVRFVGVGAGWVTANSPPTLTGHVIEVTEEQAAKLGVGWEPVTDKATEPPATEDESDGD